MTMNDYQNSAHSFASYGGNPMYPVLGLAEEAGEACGKIAKFIRKHDGIDPYAAANWVSLAKDRAKAIDDIKKELGDVMWMVAEIATNLGLKLDDVAGTNIEKLTDRANRGVIVGEGDNR